MRDGAADNKHGNRVTSLIVQGHDWNNNLALPPLYCQVGTVQAVAKKGSRSFVDPQDFIAYLDGVMAANPEYSGSGISRLINTNPATSI